MNCEGFGSGHDLFLGTTTQSVLRLWEPMGSPSA
jgi:hypothetical protein